MMVRGGSSRVAELDKLVLVGRVAGAFGVRGDLRLGAYTQEPLALHAYRDLKREDGSPALTLTAARAAKPGPSNTELVVRAAEVETREQAEAMRGVKLYVPRAALPPPEEDEFYLTDLIGLAARTTDRAPLGRIKAVLNHGAGDILEVDPGHGRATVLYPFTREVVPEVRIAEGVVVIAPPVETGEPEPGSKEEDT